MKIEKRRKLVWAASDLGGLHLLHFTTLLFKPSILLSRMSYWFLSTKQTGGIVETLKINFASSKLSKKEYGQNASACFIQVSPE